MKRSSSGAQNLTCETELSFADINYPPLRGLARPKLCGGDDMFGQNERIVMMDVPSSAPNGLAEIKW